MAAVQLSDLDDEELARRAFEILVRELGFDNALRFMTQGVQVPASATDAVRRELNRMSLDELFREIGRLEADPKG